MADLTLNLQLQRASEDGVENSPGYQADLRRFARELHDTGAAASQRGMAFDAVGATGYPIADFALLIAAPAASVIVAVCAVIQAYLSARQGRSARITIDKLVIQVDSTDDVERLLTRIARDKNAPERNEED